MTSDDLLGRLIASLIRYRDQLIAMAQFLNMNHFAPTALLRFQIRQRLRRLRNEDKEILWEGALDSP